MNIMNAGSTKERKLIRFNVMYRMIWLYKKAENSEDPSACPPHDFLIICAGGWNR